jgi:hypothetical protein
VPKTTAIAVGHLRCSMMIVVSGKMRARIARSCGLVLVDLRIKRQVIGRGQRETSAPLGIAHVVAPVGHPPPNSLMYTLVSS